MKFGKTEHPEKIAFKLAPDPEITRSTLAGLTPRKGPTKIFVGCTGWAMKEWVGNVYPKKTKPKDYLKYYGKQFNTIELNTTHYRIPTPETIENWKQSTPKDFRFCPKVVQRVSHARDLGIGSGLLIDFCESIRPLGEQLGPCFIQLPPYWGADRYAQLDTFLKNWPTEIRLAVEVRHPSWFETPQQTEKLLSLLRAYHVGAVITDVAGRRDVLHQGVTTHFAMVRWVGNGLIDNDYSRLDDWIERLRSWIAQGIHEIYFFPHEPDNLLAPEITLYLTQKIKERIPEASLRGPTLPIFEDGGQLGLF